jgi:HEAT repeat protein
VEAALALNAVKDPAGIAMLEEILHGEHELLRFDAAEALYATRKQPAERVIQDGLASGNPWIRIRAIEAVGAVGMRATPEMRRAMVHDNPSVAVAATRAALVNGEPQ